MKGNRAGGRGLNIDKTAIISGTEEREKSSEQQKDFQVHRPAPEGGLMTEGSSPVATAAAALNFS